MISTLNVVRPARAQVEKTVKSLTQDFLAGNKFIFTHAGLAFAGKLMKKDVSAYQQSSIALAKNLIEARFAIRKELGIDTVTAIQTSKPLR